MLPNWVMEVWNLSIERLVMAIDEEIITRNRCPIFNKYTICASGFQLNTKEQIKKLIYQEGGVYQGDLVCGQTTHLVINEPKGEKYNFAKLWKINIVTSKWIYDSIEAKYCLPEKKYEPDAPLANTSTPTSLNKSVQSSKGALKGTRLDIDISMIANSTTRNIVNETEANSTTMRDNTTIIVGQQSTTSLSKYDDVLKELSLIGKIKSTLFDGFGVS
jgi:topoisomerase (DNA) II binding protein 1